MAKTETEFDDYSLKVERKALYEIIADKLEDVILNDPSTISQKMPSENHLSDLFGASRPVIREALKILKDRGLIVSHQGASSVITEYDPEKFIKSVNRIICTKNVSSDQIYQVRCALEMLSVRLAAENPDPDGVQMLRKLNAEIAACRVPEEIEKRSGLDMDFHMAIAAMSGNPLLIYMTETLSTLLTPLFDSVLLENSSSDSAVPMHERIIDAVAEGDADRACDQMRAHIMLSIRGIEELEEREADSGKTPKGRHKSKRASDGGDDAASGAASSTAKKSNRKRSSSTRKSASGSKSKSKDKNTGTGNSRRKSDK